MANKTSKFPSYSRSAIENWIAGKVAASPALAAQLAANPVAALQSLVGTAPPSGAVPQFQVVQETAAELVLVQRAHGVVSTEHVSKITDKRVLLTELVNRLGKGNPSFWTQLQANPAQALKPLNFTPPAKVTVMAEVAGQFILVLPCAALVANWTPPAAPPPKSAAPAPAVIRTPPAKAPPPPPPALKPVAAAKPS